MEDMMELQYEVEAEKEAENSKNDNEDEDDEDEEEDEEEGEEGEEGEEAEEYTFRFKNGMNPLDLVENETSGLQIYQQFERMEYEALANRKRKRTATSQSKEEEVAGTGMATIMEAMRYGGFRRKTRKLDKQRGRRKGSKNKLNPEITRMLGEATLHYAHGRFEQALSVLNEVVKREPNLPDTYHTLGLVHTALGNSKHANCFYEIAALLRPEDSSLCKQLLSSSLEKGDAGAVRYYLCKAIKADPKDITLRFHLATLYVELGDYERAVATYEIIQQLWPDNVDAVKSGAKLYLKLGQIDRSLGILEEYVNGHPSEADLSVIDLLVTILMENSEDIKALQHIEHAQEVYCSGKELPINLKVRAGICHLRVGHTENAEILFSILQRDNAHDHTDLIIKVADSFMSVERYNSALKYYSMLEAEADAGIINGHIFLKIAECYASLKNREQAIAFYYKGLRVLEENIDARLSLASLLLEEGKEDEVITLLSPPISSDSIDQNCDKPNPWWLNERIIMKLYHIYRAKGMPEKFLDVVVPLVRESLCAEAHRQKVKVKKRLSRSILLQRGKVLDNPQTDNILCGIRPVASKAELLKAARARKLLQKKTAQKEEQKAMAVAAGVEWNSDDSEDELPQEVFRQPPLPNLLKDDEHQCLIVDLCKALVSLRRYEEASDIIDVSLSLAYKILPSDKKEVLRSIGAQIGYDGDPKHGFDYARRIVLQQPYSLAAWNCYYKVISRLGRSDSRNLKLLRSIRDKYKDCVPPIVISGHNDTIISHHQDAAKDYLIAHKLLPEHPLINLCVGTALINLALGFRLHNKHQCLAQGLAFLFKNMQLCENSQEAAYNIARACHHVGLVSLAAKYYEKVLAIKQKDYPIPKLPYENPGHIRENQQPGYCDLRREAAYNLHLIYRKSGAVDLARQLLKEYCTF